MSITHAELGSLYNEAIMHMSAHVPISLGNPFRESVLTLDENILNQCIVQSGCSNHEHYNPTYNTWHTIIEDTSLLLLLEE